MKRKVLFYIFYLFIFTGIMTAEEINYKKIILNIANDILELKAGYSQLSDFSIRKNLYEDKLMIMYDYHTHEPESRTGWTSGVPNPDNDGIWLYIDIHDQNSASQIHTQPVSLEYRIGNKILFLLMISGKDTKSISADLDKILKRYAEEASDY